MPPPIAIASQQLQRLPGARLVTGWPQAGGAVRFTTPSVSYVEHSWSHLFQEQPKQKDRQPSRQPGVSSSPHPGAATTNHPQQAQKGELRLQERTLVQEDTGLQESLPAAESKGTAGRWVRERGEIFNRETCKQLAWSYYQPHVLGHGYKACIRHVKKMTGVTISKQAVIRAVQAHGIWHPPLALPHMPGPGRPSRVAAARTTAATATQPDPHQEQMSKPKK